MRKNQSLIHSGVGVQSAITVIPRPSEGRVSSYEHQKKKLKRVNTLEGSTKNKADFFYRGVQKSFFREFNNNIDCTILE